MARFDSEGIEQIDAALAKLGRPAARRIVMAAANASIGVLQNASERHVVSGAMQKSISTGIYRETLDGGSVEVYPQGTDGRGVRNYLKARLIEEGRHGQKSDKFFTGPAVVSKLNSVTEKAMQDEADRILAEAGGN